MHALFFHVGVRVGLFTPDRAFDMVTKEQIKKLKPPSIKLVDLVCQELMSISREITTKVEKWDQSKEAFSERIKHHDGSLRVFRYRIRSSVCWTEAGFLFNLRISLIIYLAQE